MFSLPKVVQPLAPPEKKQAQHNITTSKHRHITTSPHPKSQHLHIPNHNISTSQHPHITTSSHHNIATSQHLHITTSPHQNIATSQHPHITTSPHHNISTSQHHHITTSPHQNIATSQHLHITTSPHHNIPTSQHPHITTSPHLLKTLILQHFADFLKYLQHEKRYSEHTLRAYESDLAQFNEFLTQNYPEPTNQPNTN